MIEEAGEFDGKKRRRYFGTAFFVSEHLLLTAGHNIVGVNGPITSISITYPGLGQVESWKLSQRKMSTIECKVVGTIYKRNGIYSKDLAILDSGSFRHSKYLPLSSIVPPPQTAVDVIGYPGEIRHEWIEAQSGLVNSLEGQAEAVRLLPNGRLTVTRGVVEAGDTTLPYHISTCPGMSGSCVLHKGVIIGNHSCIHS